MIEPQDPPRERLVGVGFGLRWEFLDELMARLEGRSFDAVPFFEIAPENYMRRGGRIPESLEYVAEHVPLITHGLMMSIGGLAPFDRAYLDALRGFVHRFRTPWHSDHLCFSGVGDRIFHDLLPLPQTEAAARHAAARIREARDRLELPMAVENISYYLRLGRPDLEEAEFINLILADADCQLLLDVNNVYVNAKNHGFDARAFIERIDLSRVVQIHVAGHEYREDDGLIVDTHGAPLIDPVYELLSFAIERTGPTAVILERDNDVPDLDEMLREWRLVDAAYQRGLDAWRKRRPPPDRRPADPRESASERDAPSRVEALQRVLDHAVRTTDDEALCGALTRGYPELGLAAADALHLQHADPRQVRVYRRLVRGNLIEAIENQLPRTAARLGDEAYRALVTSFCEEELPRSQILRDVPYEFARWAAPRLPSPLANLARFELLEFDVYTAVRGGRAAADELLADVPVAFDGSVRLAGFDHAVHLLPDDPADRTVPAAGPVAVLAYRDDEGAYRQLELTALASRILCRLLVGEPFAAAVQEACALRGVAIDASVIEGTSRLLADLAERGAVLGAAPSNEPPPAPSPFFRWLMGPGFVDL